MHTYQLKFADGRACRCIIMEPESDPSVDIGGVHAIFREDYLVSMERVIAPPPAKLPWRRDGDVWRIGSFELRKNSSGLGNDWLLAWPGGELRSSSKDEIAAAVRENWLKGA